MAVETGIVLAALLFIRKVSGTTTVTRVTEQYVEEGWLHIVQDKPIPEYVAVFRIHGPFLFGGNEKISQHHGVLRRAAANHPAAARDMTAIDATGLQAFEDLAEKCRAGKRTLICVVLPAARQTNASSRV